MSPIKTLYAPFEYPNSKVRFTFYGEVHYGDVAYASEFDEDIKKDAKKGKVIVTDAIFPVTYALLPSDLTILPHDPTDKWRTPEYDNAVEAAYTAARAASDAATGLVGKIFDIGVADGSAWYTVTKETARTLTVEWRGFHNPDRYHDMVLGFGGTFPKNRIAPLIRAADGIRAIFARKSA